MPRAMSKASRWVRPPHRRGTFLSSSSRSGDSPSLRADQSPRAARLSFPSPCPPVLRLHPIRKVCATSPSRATCTAPGIRTWMPRSGTAVSRRHGSIGRASAFGNGAPPMRYVRSIFPAPRFGPATESSSHSSRPRPGFPASGSISARTVTPATSSWTFPCATRRTTTSSPPSCTTAATRTTKWESGLSDNRRFRPADARARACHTIGGRIRDGPFLVSLDRIGSRHVLERIPVPARRT